MPLSASPGLVMDGDNTELPPVVRDNDELVHPPSVRGYNDVKGKPPDECAKNYVYRGGSPLSIIGEATCNVPIGLGIEILFLFLRGCTIVHDAWETMDTWVYRFLFRMRFEDWIGMEYPFFLFL